MLTNAKCLSEGVDVPALDAVLFLTPRGSQVDVVQSVGRVMRKAPGKELGYIVLPVVVPSGMAPDEALRDNERYKVVWQVLQALRSHDDRFQATVNQIELNKRKPDVIEIVAITGPTHGGDGETATGTDPSRPVQKSTEQLLMEFPADAFRDAMYARIVAKVGERRYWETWAKDIAGIAEAHQIRIRGLLAGGGTAADQFEHFLAGLRGNLNDSITTNQAVEMLAQHLITRPVFEALFQYSSFLDGNPVAQAMQKMLNVLDEHALDAENATLEGFYGSVRRRVAGIDNAAGKQRVLIELYDKFFATAFPKTVAKLGIVYTPVEIVDFILRSTDEVLRAEFGQGLTDPGVHVLDPFTGTGTFLVRLLQSGLIETHDLARKYAEELHANEILLLAYYIAAANIETTYEELAGAPAPFPGLVLTDSFQSWEDDDTPDLDIIPENNARLERQKLAPIQVIIGNPPYSVGQDSANDDNANEKYETLDAAIRDTYAALSTAVNKNSLYDSYIRAIKWATLRIKDRGIVAFVTNGGFLDSNVADGMRLSLADEYSAIYIYNLRGNRRNGGAEGRPIWEAFAKGSGGSIATIAIVLLVKNPAKSGSIDVRYAQVGDFTTASEKVAEIVHSRSYSGLNPISIMPNEHGDWLAQRAKDFSTFLPIQSLFTVYSGGLKTNRDTWCYGFSTEAVSKKMQRLIATYESDRSQQRTAADATQDDSLISWNRSLLADLVRGQVRSFKPAAIREAAYRPFTKQRVYFDRRLNDMVYRLPSLYPESDIGTIGSR